jgi:S1-C subfamily serine protease
LLDDLQLQALDLNDSPVGTVLLNAKGELLGMIIQRHGDEVVEVPGGLAERVGSQIAKYGHISHGWLGIEGVSTEGASTDPPSTTHVTTIPGASQLEVPVGVKVLAVGADTSAAVAGLRAGDVIEAVNGLAVDSMQALQAALYTMPPRTAVRLTVERGRMVRTVDAQLHAAA